MLTMCYSSALTPAARGCALGAVLEEAVILLFLKCYTEMLQTVVLLIQIFLENPFLFPLNIFEVKQKDLNILYICLYTSVPVLQLVCTHRVIPTHLREASLGFLSAYHLLWIWEMRPGFPEHIRLRTCSMEPTNAWF